LLLLHGYFLKVSDMKRYESFKTALNESWGKDTAYWKDAEGWTKENPALGQCAITALLFNELYGGKIYSGVSDTGIVHYWNRKFGIKRDFTKQQFPRKMRFTNVKRWTREELLASGNVAERYEMLKSRVIEKMKGNK